LSTEQPGLPIIVQIDTDDGSLVREIALGPIDAIVFAHRLTAAALRRFGRAQPGHLMANWSQSTGASRLEQSRPIPLWAAMRG
jgi:hypothetical protein